uniref:Uncharacterized protein n=1 Tax=Acrobeloides nanus TaxID=290746 RepID=A0A914CSE6_9BILA
MQSELEISHPHEEFYERLYRELNPTGAPEVDAKTAANFLKGSNLDVMQLSQIWELADYRKKGSLDIRGVYIAFKLIAGVQQGHPILPGVLGANLDAPRFPSLSASSYSPASRMASPNVDWDIDVAEQSKYEAIFYSLSPVNGKLTGDRVRPVLLNSQLPHQILARIWELADIDHDGMLDKYEMCVALHLVYKCLQNEALPNALPVSLVHPTKRGTLSRRTSYAGTPATPTLPAPPPARPSLSASSRTSSISSLTKGMGEHPTIESPVRTAMTPLSKSIFDVKTGEWPIDKNLYEQEFRRYDTDMDGLVTGMDVRIPLMGSGLAQPTLAHIWALVDISKSGKLNLEQFALIMELIKEAKQGITLPEILPAHLVPYSLRFGATMAPSLALSDSSNPRIQELNEEIQKIIEDRRTADQDLLQLEADT